MLNKKGNQTIESEITARTFLVYTGIFFVMISLIYSWFVRTGTSFIWESDGFTQHYQLFHDYIFKLREWVNSGSVSLWDWNIGLGADVLHSYGYYVIGDPFVYLGLLFPAYLMEAAYHLLILLRVWAVGISFLFFLRSQRLSHHAGLAAAIAYSFTHFVVFNVTRHPFFILPLIWYPLLCLGIDKILKGKSSGLFMLAVTVSALSNFYFFYKLTLLTVFYALVRFAYLNKKWDWAFFLKVFLRTAYGYIVGLLISASLFLPMVFGFLDSSRESGGMGINMLFYPLEYYWSLIQHMVSPGSYFWLIGGFPILSLFGLLYIWKNPDYRFIRSALIILVVFALVPFFGSMMNGFSGPYNRFSFALPFFISLALAYFIDQREDFDKNYLKKVKWVLILFSFFAVITWIFIDGSLPYMLVPVALGWGVWGYFKRPLAKRLSYLNENRLIVGLVMLNLIVNAMYYYYPFGMNAMSGLIEYGTVEEEYRQVLAGGQELLPDRGIDPYRVGVTSQDNHIRNQFLYLDVMGLNSYLSVTNGYLTDFAEAIETAGFQLIQPLRNGIDDRRIANHLLGVRYIITEAKNQAYLPFGYEIVEELNNHENEPYILAETTDAYPFAYAMGNAISENDFMELNAVEREATLVDNVVLEDAVHQELSLKESSNQTVVKELQYEIRNDEDETLEIPDGDLRFEKENPLFTLVLDDPAELAGHEWFIRLDGLDYRTFEESSWLRQSTNYRLSVSDGHQRKSIYQSDIYSFSSYFHREHMLFNLGNVTENDGIDRVEIAVDNSGIYNVDDITVYALPVSAQEDERIAAEKKERALDIRQFSDDRIEGEIFADANELLATSVPFSEGWSAVVNGEEKNIFKTNIGFIGVELNPGENTVQFSYRTPYLRLGMALSLVGIGLAVLNVKYWNKASDKIRSE